MRILIAEDDPISRQVLEDALDEWGYQVVVTQNGNEAWHVLQQEDAPLLAILGWVTPGMDGVEVCRKVRQLSKGSYIYILMLTGKAAKQDIVAAMEAGADDYVSKPFDEQELQVRLHAGRRIIGLQEALRTQATHDALTGVWNRAMITKILERELTCAERRGSSVGILMADLDHFKWVNDTPDT